VTESIVDYSYNRHIMKIMTNKAKNRLCILLACLLGIAPLSRAIAEQHNPLPSQQDHQMSAALQHEGHSPHQLVAAQDCENCASSYPCDSHDYHCNQCASCIHSFLPVLLDIHFRTLSQNMPSGEHGATSYLPSPLFRPPRS